MSETGTFLCYVPKKFSEEHLKVIDAANHIIEQYESRGLSMTLRQVYYQFVARGWLPNKQAEYTRLGNIISDARLAGLVSWTALEDLGRNLKGHRTFDGPSEAVASVVSSYKIDMWANQDWRPEVWVEKQAQEGNIAGICSQLRVDFFATKGYNSQSEQWKAGQRMASYIRQGQRPIVFYLGDHDPSGIDMTRDVQERLSLFAGTPILVQRLALNWPQIEKYNPPPNPVKLTDSRSSAYQREHGDESWELDALAPDVIADTIREAVLAVRDATAWDEMMQQEVDDKRILQEMADNLGGDD